ncbi:DUF6880 family protein, partial [Rhizobium leguminosarum]
MTQPPATTRKMPMISAHLANLLFSAGRAKEALEMLNEVDATGQAGMPVEWQLARVEELEALGRQEEDQTYRWTCF